MGECRAEIKTNETEVVQSVTSSVVEDNEGPAWCDRVGKEVAGLAIDAVVGGYRRKIGVRAENIQSKLSLGKMGGPVVDGERGVSCSQETKEVPTKSLNGAFCGVGAFLVWGNQLVGNVLVVEVGEQGHRGFVVSRIWTLTWCPS